MEEASTQINTHQTVVQEEVEDDLYADLNKSLILKNYISTSLVSRTNISLADIELSQYD